MQECPLDFSRKSNTAKTAPNFACQFVYACRKLPCTHFPSFLLRILEIKYAKTLAMSQSASFETALLHNTISFVSLLSFFQMLTLTPRVKPEFPVSIELGLGLPLETRVNVEGLGYGTRLGLGFLLGLGLVLKVKVIA